MLTQLATVKTRLAIPAIDVQYDSILTPAIVAISARFDLETGRTLARTQNFNQEFNPDTTEIIASCYPVEAVTKFELKSSESEGWLEQSAIEYLIRSSCIICLSAPLSILHSPFRIARVTYTGGYVLPGTAPAPGQTPLPSDLENAAVEQVAFWFQNREAIGQTRTYLTSGNYLQFADTDLLPSVRSILRRHTRILL